MIILSLLLLIGIVMIYLGAEGLVWGGSQLATRFNVPPIVIGLSVVAFGTSLPEFTVSLYSVINNVQDIAIGNVVGSNVANVALILAASVVIFPIAANYDKIRADLWIVIVITAFFMLLSMDGSLGRIDGALLVVGITLYLWRLSRIRTLTPELATKERGKHVSTYVVGIVGGLVVLASGTHLFTTAAVELARIIGISELVIGITIVAVGTSLPELATSLVAAFRKQTGIVLGNILGSNVFNLMVVMGIIPVFKPIIVPDQSRLIQMPIMLGLTLVLVPILKYQRGIKRGVGVALLSIYVVFTVYMYHLDGL
ncbi:MAG: calcium/sodium antiporter [Fidelibacterota bacterium]|nr:MAG: calcium/sodium antiporter [Candidatus Neomarinimicrobiota bacterium]